MSKVKIEKPKVFISYAWGTEEYQSKVLAFATDLMNEGIDVEFDKWSLKEGNDTYAFMEQSVTDESITNVLMLLDKQYTIKADSRDGGVGTETQIISPEIYNKTKQEKFIPIVFERDENGDIHKPAYLKGLLHFDLSIDENYNTEYQRLVKRLYGVEIYEKPKLGNKPSWVENPPMVTVRVHNMYSVLKNNQPDRVKVESFNSFLSQFKDRIIEFSDGENSTSISIDKYISVYEKTKVIRDEFLMLLQYISYIDNGERYVANMMEETYNSVIQNSDVFKNIRRTLLHEIFIYIIAICCKNKNYEAVSYILGRTYFNEEISRDNAENFNIFRFSNENMDRAMNIRDDKNYYSGTACYWMQNINTEICSQKDFVFADLLCFNYSIFGKDYHFCWRWFPITYAYDNRYNSVIGAFARRLQSTEHLQQAAGLFGYNTVEELKKKFIEVKELQKNGEFRDYRYSGAFDSAPMLLYYINAEDLGKYK